MIDTTPKTLVHSQQTKTAQIPLVVYDQSINRLYFTFIYKMNVHNNASHDDVGLWLSPSKVRSRRLSLRTLQEAQDVKRNRTIQSVDDINNNNKKKKHKLTNDNARWTFSAESINNTNKENFRGVPSKEQEVSWLGSLVACHPSETTHTATSHLHSYHPGSQHANSIKAIASPRSASLPVASCATRSPWSSPDSKKPHAIPMPALLEEASSPSTKSQAEALIALHQSGASETAAAAAAVQESTRPVALVHARLDSSLQCSWCQASHTLYLMYPIIKTLDTWNKSSKFLCSQCFSRSDGHPVEEEEEDDDEEEAEKDDGELIPVLLPSLLTQRQTPRRLSLGQPKPKASRPKTTCLIQETSCNVPACLDLLQAVEEELDVAARSLSEDCRPALAASIRQELLARHGSNPNASAKKQLEMIQQSVEEELDLHDELWQAHWDLLQDTASVLQAALDSEGGEECDLLLAYYQWRADQCRPQETAVGNDLPTWKRRADQVLNERDMQQGVGPGHFWGASGTSYWILGNPSLLFSHTVFVWTQDGAVALPVWGQIWTATALSWKKWQHFKRVNIINTFQPAVGWDGIPYKPENNRIHLWNMRNGRRGSLKRAGTASFRRNGTTDS